MSKFFNPGAMSFMAAELVPQYKASGAWPDNAAEVSDEVYREFSGKPPAGKRMGAKSGLPCWVADIPDPEEVKAAAKASALAGLAELDRLSIRALRAFASGTETDADKEKLAQYDAKAEELREVLAK